MKMLIGFNVFDDACLEHSPSFELPAGEGGGADFAFCHFSPKAETVAESAERAAKVAKAIADKGMELIANFEFQNFSYNTVSTDGYDWANRPDGTHRLRLPESVVAALASAGNLVALAHDEFEHAIINRNLSISLGSRGKISVPVFPLGECAKAIAARDLLSSQLEEYVAELKALGAPAFCGEHVFPVLYHLFAANGIIPNFKSQKESFSDVQFACAAGAALEYDKELWNCVDLWFRNTCPGHSPNEMYHNLLFAWLAGVNRVYVEHSSHFISEENGKKVYNGYGQTFSRFTSQYRGKERDYDISDYKPRVGIIHAEDTYWGQGPLDLFWRRQLFGDKKIRPGYENREWVRAMHVITHGESRKDSLSWDRVWFSSIRRHRSFASMNSAAVFDETVPPEKLSSLKLLFLTGAVIPDATIEAVEKLVCENGLTVVTPRRFAPASVSGRIKGRYSEIRQGNGLWIVTNDLASRRLKYRLTPFLGNKGEITLDFGDTVRRLKISADGESFEILQ